MRKTSRGFSLIELMIAVAILGILATIAYPTYLDKVRAAKRVEAKSALLRIANREEQYYTIQHEYTKDLSSLGMNTKENGAYVTDNGAYIVSVGYRNNDPQTFQIVASATKDQNNDQCVTFGINEIGKKSASGGGGSDSGDRDLTDTCW